MEDKLLRLLISNLDRALLTFFLFCGHYQFHLDIALASSVAFLELMCLVNEISEDGARLIRRVVSRSKQIELCYGAETC